MSFATTMLAILSDAAENVEELGIEAELENIYQADKEEWNLACHALETASTKIHSKKKFIAAMLEGLGVAAEESRSLHPADVVNLVTTPES